MGVIKRVNLTGIPCIESVGYDLTTEGLTFNFNKHPFVYYNFSGLIAVKVPLTFTAPDTPVNVYFNTIGVSNSTVQLIGLNNTAITTSTWSGQGIHIVFYDRENNILQLIN